MLLLLSSLPCAFAAAVLLVAVVTLTAQAGPSFEPAVAFPTGSLPTSVTIVDVNGEGKPDLITANTGANTASVLLGAGTGSFGAKTDFPTGLVPHGVAVADLNGDGIPDLAVVNVTDDTVSILLGLGNGGFGPRTDHVTGVGARSVAIGT